MNDLPLDADWEETDGVHEIRGLLPCMSIDFYQFAKEMAFRGPVEFEVINDAESNTKLRFTIKFTDEAGIRHTVTSKYFRQLMLQAAALQRKATEQNYKRRSARPPKRQPALI